MLEDEVPGEVPDVVHRFDEEEVELPMIEDFGVVVGDFVAEAGDLTGSAGGEGCEV